MNHWLLELLIGFSITLASIGLIGLLLWLLSGGRWRAVGHHFVRFGETYLVLPLVLGAILGSLLLYRWGTGRPSMEDPLAEIVATLQTLTPLVLLIALAGYVQTQMIGYRGKEGAPMSDDAFDLVAFLALLFSFAKIGGLL